MRQREVKFRAWRKDTNEMFYSDFHVNAYGKVLWWYLEEGYTDNKTAVVVLMQYTGLKDKNGKEIYEGDIVKTGEEFGEVMYDPDQAAFIILFQPHNKKQKSGCANLASTLPSPSKEIIGNRFEHPELLNPLD